MLSAAPKRLTTDLICAARAAVRAYPPAASTYDVRRTSQMVSPASSTTKMAPSSRVCTLTGRP
jgi:hypothetical protein